MKEAKKLVSIRLSDSDLEAISKFDLSPWMGGRSRSIRQMIWFFTEFFTPDQWATFYLSNAQKRRKAMAAFFDVLNGTNEK